MKKLLTVLAVVAFATTGFAAEISPDISGQAWFRYEGSDNTSDFESDLDDSFEWSEYLIRLNLNFELTNNLNLYVSPQFWSYFGSMPGPVMMGYQGAESDDLQLFEGYLKLTDLGGSVDLTVGRQALTFGNGFIIGNTDFYGGQAFDGIRLDFGAGEGAISVFDMKLRETIGPMADDASLYGAYGAWNVLDGHEFDAYVFYWRDRAGTGTGTLALITAGLRLTRPMGDGGFDWSAEFAYQTGEWDGMDVDQRGFGFEGWVGYTFDNDSRVGLKGAWFQGNDDANKMGGFLNPGSSWYARYGRYDYLYGYWMSDMGGRILSATFDQTVNDEWSWGAAATWFGADEKPDGFSSRVAAGADLYVKYTQNEYLSWLVSGSYLDPHKDWLGEDAALRGYIHAQVNW